MAALKMDFTKMVKSFEKTAKERGMFVGWWVPVSKRLPDKNGRYLVTVKQGYITFGAWVGVAENWAQVIAWMPLPEPYKAESEEE